MVAFKAAAPYSRRTSGWKKLLVYKTYFVGAFLGAYSLQGSESSTMPIFVSCPCLPPYAPCARMLKCNFSYLQTSDSRNNRYRRSTVGSCLFFCPCFRRFYFSSKLTAIIITEMEPPCWTGPRSSPIGLHCTEPGLRYFDGGYIFSCGSSRNLRRCL